MITYPSIPVLTDLFISQFNTEIVNHLTWLNNPLGKIQSITKIIDGRAAAFPAMYTDSGEYIDVFPNDTLVNYSWFALTPIQNTGSTPRAKYVLTGRLNFFLDLSTIYPTVTASRDLDSVKLEIMQALNNISLLSGAVRFTSVSEAYTDVYSGYTLPALQDKYFMQPYAGLSFEVQLYIKNLTCPD